ncbi:MAG: FtsK/SpoIIIE domain-containing protein, partial [Actinomycetia bacterium]|nr:FtsK/SpoIIIE domain-containing protein [Actinomycetes bacterium]
MAPPAGPDDETSRWAPALLPVPGDRRARAHRWARVKGRYRSHLDAVRAEAAAAAAGQRAAREACFPEPDTLPDVAARGDRLWERRPGDPDFGSVRLGRGTEPALCPVRIAGGEGRFADADPDLADAADRVIRESAALPAMPVTIGLGQVGSVAVVGDPDPSRALVAAWLAGLAAFHAPGELRIMGLVPPEAAQAWDWLKWLPHARDPEAGDGFGRVSRAVTADPGLFTRHAGALARQRRERPWGGEHVIVVVDGYRPGQGPSAVDALLPAAAGAGITIILLVRGEHDVPATCGARIGWEDTGTVRYTESGQDGLVLAGVVPDRIGPEPAGRLARVLAPLALRAGETAADFADPVRLVELLGSGDARDLDTKAAMATLGSLAAGIPPGFVTVPLGRTADGEPLSIDLREAGPHGIITGPAGSGKSECLRSFATALAVRHAPDLVSLLLVDAAGSGALADLAEFPHAAGLVTDLAGDPALADRLNLVLAGELTRRQQILQDAGRDSIEDYQQALAAGTGLVPLPRLVIAVDEFDELLAARPGLLDTFLAIARLGPSLGVSLLLTARRPGEGGARELDPHLRYRISLGTSAAGVGGPSGIPGAGCLSADGVQVRFRAATCATAPPRRPAGGVTSGTPGARPVLRALDLGSSRPATPENTAAEYTGPGTGTPDVRVLARDARRAAARARQVWMTPLPRALTLGALRETLGGALEHQDLHQRDWVAVGLVDRPEQQVQEALWYSPRGPGASLGLAGAPGTGKSSFLRSLVLAL